LWDRGSRLSENNCDNAESSSKAFGNSRPAARWNSRDVLANGAGVSCSALLGLPIRTLIAIL
jgi:hypothetical protein